MDNNHPVEDYETSDEYRDPRFPPGALVIALLPFSIITWGISLWMFPFGTMVAFLTCACVGGVIGLATGRFL